MHDREAAEYAGGTSQVMFEKRHRIEQLVLTLMDSPFYLTMPLKERHALLKRLIECHPSVFEDEKAAD
ncbi:MAG: hypothetical protein AB1390_08330 [Nitrospirota bacterium]